MSTDKEGLPKAHTQNILKKKILLVYVIKDQSQLAIEFLWKICKKIKYFGVFGAKGHDLESNTSTPNTSDFNALVKWLTKYSVLNVFKL